MELALYAVAGWVIFALILKTITFVNRLGAWLFEGEKWRTSQPK